MTPKIIFVEGNIGAGKTTFLRNINKFDKKYQIIYEPVDEWIKSGMLNKFYKNPEKYSYDFQLYCLQSRFMLFKKIDKSVDYVFIERSPLCDRFVFAEVCLENQEELLEKYKRIYNQYMHVDYIQQYNYPYHFLYLKTPYEKCYENIITRSRNEELNISKKYLENLENKHDDWLGNYEQLILDHFKLYSKDSVKYIEVNNLDVRNQEHINIILNKISTYIN